MDDLCSCLFPCLHCPAQIIGHRHLKGVRMRLAAATISCIHSPLLYLSTSVQEMRHLYFSYPPAYRGKEDSSQFQLIFRWHGEGDSCCRNKHILWRHFLTLQKENTFTTRTSAFVVQEMSKSSVIPASAIKPGVFGENPRKLPGGWFTFCPQTVTQFSVPSNPYKSIKY